jgi:hypothetical protein
MQDAAVPAAEDILESALAQMEANSQRLARLLQVKKLREEVIKEIEAHKKKNSEKGERYSVKGKKHTRGVYAKVFNSKKDQYRSNQKEIYSSLLLPNPRQRRYKPSHRDPF